MAKTIHRLANPSDNHVIHGWEVSSAAARLALAPTAADLGRVARQTDDGSLWACVGYGPASWRRVDFDSGALVKASGSVTERSLDRWMADVFNVMAYGAKGDGVTDDRAAIQACFDAALATARGIWGLPMADIVFPSPSAYYKIGSGLVLSPASGQVFINLRGLGAAQAIPIVYTGAGGTALTIKNNARFTLENLHILDQGTGAVGIFFGSTLAGTGGGGCVVKTLAVEGFGLGVQIGNDADNAMSELAFHQLSLENNGVGVRVAGYNSLNVWFFGLLSSANGTSVHVKRSMVEDSSLNLFVVGASIGFRTDGAHGVGSAPAFDFETAGNYTLENVFSEYTSGQFLRVGPSDPALGPLLPGQFTMRGCTVKASTSTRMQLYMAGAYSFTGCRMPGIELSGHYAGDKGSLSIMGGVVEDPTPVTRTAGNSSAWLVTMCGVGSNSANNQGTFDDERYVFQVDGTKRSLWSIPWSQVATTLPTAHPSFNSGMVLGQRTVRKVTATSPANGSSQAPQAIAGDEWTYSAGAGVASFTLNSFYGGVAGQRALVRIVNASGGALAVTWSGNWKMAAWTNPANGFSRSIEFAFDGTNWVEVGRTPADVPN